MDESYEKEIAKLEAQNEDRKADLITEIEARNTLIKELEKKAAEERSHGHQKEAAEYERLAEEQLAIIKEKNELIRLSDETTAANREKIWNNYQTKAAEASRKEVEELQKQHERKLKNLETEHNNELKAAKDLETAKKILKEEYDLPEDKLAKIKTFEQAKSELILAQDRETYAAQEKFLIEQIAKLEELLVRDEALSIFGGLFSEDEREQVLEFIEELQNRLSKIDNPEEQSGWSAEDKKLGSFIDLFGFTADEWNTAFENLDTMSGKLQLVQMGVQALTNAWNMFHQAQQRNMQRDLQVFTQSVNRKKEALAQQLEEGYISQETYNAKVAKLEADLEKKKAEMEYKSAMSEWRMSLLQAASNTALGITSALAMTPPNLIIAGIVGGMGAIQTGLIAGNKPKKGEGYFYGGETGGSGVYDNFGRELADGALHANEYVIPEWLRADPVIARMEEFIEARRNGLNPNFSNQPENIQFQSSRTPDSNFVADSQNSTSDSEIATALSELTAELRHLRENPIEAKLTRTMEAAKYISDDLTKYNNHRNKNRR